LSEILVEFLCSRRTARYRLRGRLLNVFNRELKVKRSTAGKAAARRSLIGRTSKRQSYLLLE
jgi:hypothetical protein